MSDSAEPRSTRVTGRFTRSIWPSVLALAGVTSLAAIALAAEGTYSRSYGASSTHALSASLVGATILVAVGTAGSIHRPGSVIGRLVAFLAIIWCASEVIGWTSGPPLIRSMGLVIEPMIIPVLVHLTLAFPRGRAVSRLDRVLISSAYLTAVLAGAVRAAFYDPIRDMSCHRMCSNNIFLRDPRPELAHLMGDGFLWVTILIGLLVVVRVARRALKPSSTRFDGTRNVLGLLTLSVLAEVGRAGLLLADPIEDPRKTPFLAMFFVKGVLLALVGLGVGWELSRMWRVRRSLETLAERLEATPGVGLQGVLAEALGDESVEVAYWLPWLGRHVDANGRTVTPGPGPRRAIAAIERSGNTLGLVAHNSALAVADLQREIGSAARLAVDNERLRAELLAQVREIRASQSRIVEAGDALRRQIERDLHDGAQQRLLALSYQVRLAQAAAAQEGDSAAARSLAAASDEVLIALGDLRALAHGIFPSILVDGGLSPALRGLSDEAPMPVEIEAPADRSEPAVEMAAYLTIREAIEAAARRASGHLRVSTKVEDDDLTMEILFEGSAPQPGDMVRLTDRIGALGGSVQSGDERLRVVIPCG